MKKQITILALIISSISFAQIKFEKGYIIDDSGDKKEVLIKNMDWLNSPSSIEYKTDIDSKPINADIKSIKEFSVGNIKYIRKTVDIDKSSEDLAFLSTEKKPKYTEETVFLKSVVEGKANLLQYKTKGLTRYFYSVDNAEPKQLVYKIYSYDNSLIAYNNDFRNQLEEQINCNLTNKEIENTNYKLNDLSKVFFKYNQCNDSNYKNSAANREGEKQNTIHLNIKPGVRFASASVDIYNPYVSPNNVDLDSEVTFSIGAELEYVLPINKNKWSVFVEPTFQSYKSSKEFTINKGQVSEENVKRTVDYKSIDIPFGIRHYFHLNDKSKFFANVAYVVSVNLKDSKITSEYNPYEISSGNSVALGGGFKYNDKYSIEVRYFTPRNLLKNQVDKNIDYNAFSIIFGYTLF